MKRLYRCVSWAFLGLVVIAGLLGAMAPAVYADPHTSVHVEAVLAPSPSPDATKDPSVAAQTSSPGVLEQFGPPGVIITTVLTGVLMIIKSVNEGKKIDVATYKERASDAEARSNEEIGKVHKKLGELEKKLDDVIADRDRFRDTLEERKAHFTQQILDMERRHQRELEDMHSALMVEIHVRHKLERLLAENGIQIPNTPIPYTKVTKDTVSGREAAVRTDQMRVIREAQEASD